MISSKSGLVSVVVTSYNHAEFLVDRMESLLNQTYQHLEILVIDDYSTQNNVEILRRYESHPKVKLLLNEKNTGLVSVTNHGIQLSQGEFVLIAQCDDCCDPRMIEMLVNALMNYPTAGVAFCGSQLINENNLLLGYDFCNRERSFQIRCATDTLLTGNEMSRFLFHSCVIPNMSALLMRRQCATYVKGFSSHYKLCMDWEMFFNIATAYDFAYVAQPLNMFRQHRSTVRSKTNDRDTYKEYFELLLMKIESINLTLIERVKYRYYVMRIWATHLISESLNGFFNFFYHLKIVLRYDPSAFIFLWLAIIIRMIEVLYKISHSLVFYIYSLFSPFQSGLFHSKGDQ